MASHNVDNMLQQRKTIGGILVEATGFQSRHDDDYGDLIKLEEIEVVKYV